MSTSEQTEETRIQETREAIISDYRTAVRSRQASLIGRREVLTGKAKFGIFGDGKEVAQLAWARAFRRGDWRSGYYRDQTFMFALGAATLEQFFAQLYADADVARDPSSAGRSMNAHFASRFLDQNGNFKRQTDQFNISADMSPTGSQMPRLVGLGWASRLYRELRIPGADAFSRDGNEIAWGTIGNASCAEGMFWESLNAAGVLGIPVVVSIWDDGYGISVANEHQVTKDNISELLRGFQRPGPTEKGFELYSVRAWDYPALCETYLAVASVARAEHVPAIIHVTEVTQPQGHSTSGSHERYKSKERLQWEVDFDCIRRMREWMIAQGIATAQELDEIEKEDVRLVREAQRRAWDAYRAPIDTDVREALSLLDGLGAASPEIETLASELRRTQAPYRRDAMRAVTSALVLARDGVETGATRRAAEWLRVRQREGDQRYAVHLHSSGAEAARTVPEIAAEYAAGAPVMNGFEVLNHCFDAALRRDPRLVIFGEDVGKLGDVNQGCLGLQEKHGDWRVMDTGIRECTILGQAIGAAMRGLRPIAEIQYLDYLLYALQLMSDDLATLRWRSAGGQKAPVIIRTRGHRLEGIWHSGSPMGGILNLVRGIYICVPRNMTQAAGFYNTLMRGDDPALVVEVLNGYRTKEKLPSNIAEMTVPLGVPEILREGKDVTLVAYGATVRIVQEAADLLARAGIEAEVIDVRTILPFDTRGVIVESLKKTSRIAFIDEDVPGGATAFMLQQVLERDGGYEWLDSRPLTIAAKEHRPSYGSDGDYWSKPNRESIFAGVQALLHEAMPERYPPIL